MLVRISAIVLVASLIAWSGAGWDNLGTLLRAGAAGAADAPGPMPRIVIHFDQGATARSPACSSIASWRRGCHST